MVRIHALLSLEVQIKTGLVALMMMGTVTVTLTRLVITDAWDVIDGADDTGNATQWVDNGGDTFGDNMTGTFGDSCVGTPGSSYIDRYGCTDTDSDGYSDPGAVMVQPTGRMLSSTSQLHGGKIVMATETMLAE